LARVLFILQSAFSLWLLVDAYSRPRVPRFWYFIILMPFGEWFYFFKFKIHDPEFAWLKTPFIALFEKPASIEELRFRLEQTPSFDNRVALAQALYDHDECEESAALFEEAVKTNGTSCEALYGLAVSRIALNDDEQAIDPLRKLLELETSYREYDGWAKLTHCLWQVDRKEEALDSLAELVKNSPRLPHRMLYAHYLSQDERLDAAQEQLITGIRDFEYAPSYIKRTNRALVRQAKEMLQRLSGPS
jgi:hypothetical protein